MKKFCSIALAALALGAICLPPAEAAYKPKISSKMGGQFTKDVQKVVSALKAMPKPLRWTFYAEKLGLLFMPPNGANGHNSNTGDMLDGSHFIGVDGTEYDGRAEYKARPQNGVWTFCAGNTDRLGREVVFSKLSSEVTAFVLENAKYQLEKMAEEQPERRDMYLAYLAKLCYLPDGKSPYGKPETRTGPHKKPFQCYELGGKGCKFVDTEGTEHNFDDISRKYSFLHDARWDILNVCAHHVGRKDILDLCPEEVKKLRANYKKKMQELGGNATGPKEDKEEEETSEPSEKKTESLAKKLGVTYRPKTNADRMGGQFKKDLDSVVKYLKSLPKPQRWYFITERLGLLFISPSGNFGYSMEKNYRYPGTHFIGANGMEYDCDSELAAFPSIDDMGAKSNITDRLGRDLVFSQFPDEVAELVLQNAKYHLEMAAEIPEARDSILARLARLEYLPDGKSSYVRQTWKWGQTNTVHEYRLQGPGEQFHFIDSEGKEHRIVDAFNSIKDGRWGILVICAHHLGADAILALCPDEVKKLRANYKKKMQELGVGAGEAKEDKEEDTNEPSEKAESLAKKLGVTYRPKTNADGMGGQFKKDLDSVVKYLKSLPKSIRWCFITERMGLMFMPQDGIHGYGSNGWFRAGAHFIGSDGLEYDSKSEAEGRPSGSPWVPNSDLTDRLGREVVFSKFPTEVAELVLQNAKYQLDKLATERPEGRDAILTRLAQLEYQPDGTAPYVRITWKGPHGDMLNEYKMNAPGKNFYFTDTEGKERLNKDAINGIEGRFVILLICAHHLGADAILALCPEEVKKLRANREKRMQELKK